VSEHGASLPDQPVPLAARRSSLAAFSGVRSRRSRPFASLAFWLAAALAPAAAWGRTLVVYGAAEAGFRVSKDFPLELRPYHGGAFEQSVESAADGKQVRLVSRPGLVELGTPHPHPEAGPFLTPVEPLPEEARAEALRLGSTCTSRRELVEGVLDWLVGRVEVQAGTGPAQEPAEVLARKSGNCVGLTRLAVAMLRSAGVPARSAHAFRLQLRDGRVTGGAFHRLLEVEYPEVGWVASDVGRTKNFLPPDTLILAVEGETLGPEATLVEADPARPFYRSFECRRWRSELLTLDEQSWPPGRTLSAAWAPGHPLSRAAIVGSLVDEPEDVVLVAEGARGRYSASRAGSMFAFSGLGPGSYTILVQTGRGVARSGPWRVEERELLRVKLDLGALAEGGPAP
jgi:transglutaminase superfamily protein